MDHYVKNNKPGDRSTPAQHFPRFFLTPAVLVSGAASLVWLGVKSDLFYFVFIDDTE